jgi:hypothetical protein
LQAADQLLAADPLDDEALPLRPRVHLRGADYGRAQAEIAFTEGERPRETVP